MMRAMEHAPEKSTSIVRFDDFRFYLQNELVMRCRRNPRYSLRSFAKFLQMDTSSLAKILKGTRPIGRITITKLGLKLGLDVEQINRFVAAHSRVPAGPQAQPIVQGSASSGSSAGNYRNLALNTFRIMSDWYYNAILELIRVKRFKSSPAWLAKALGITVNEVNIALERLQQIGLIEILPSGKIIDRSGGYTETLPNPYSDAALRHFQKQVLEKALIALESVPVSKRDQTTVTVAIDTRKIQAAKEKIKSFRRSLAKFLSDSKSLDQVYHLSVSLYPITNI